MSRRQQPANRAGFGLVSLIVVIAVIALLLGLFFPAIARVRESASRMKSSNNLKQLGLGVLNFESANAQMPAGQGKDGISVHAQLLPYLEQEAVYRKLLDSGAKSVEGVRIITFESPRDPITEVSAGLAPTNYLFNAGSKPALKDNDGLFYPGSAITIAGITDGTSNTVICGETLKGSTPEPASVARQHVRLKAGALKKLDDQAGVADFAEGKNLASNRGASWADSHFLQTLSTATRLPNAAEPDVDCGGAGGLSALRSLDGTITLGWCDGHVSNIKADAVKLEIWKAVHTRAGGEPATLE